MDPWLPEAPEGIGQRVVWPPAGNTGNQGAEEPGEGGVKEAQDHEEYPRVISHRKEVVEARADIEQFGEERCDQADAHAPTQRRLEYDAKPSSRGWNNGHRAGRRGSTDACSSRPRAASSRSPGRHNAF